MAQKSMNRIRNMSFMRPTNDCWAPSFDGGFVECRGFVQQSVFPDGRKTYWAKIVLSGDDDYSLEKEFFGTRMECIDFFQKWSNTLYKMSLININDAKNLGFTHL